MWGVAQQAKSGRLEALPVKDPQMIAQKLWMTKL